MPELPEVETVVRGLRSLITGQTIQRAEVYREKTVQLPLPKPLPLLFRDTLLGA